MKKPHVSIGSWSPKAGLTTQSSMVVFLSQKWRYCHVLWHISFKMKSYNTEKLLEAKVAAFWSRNSLSEWVDKMRTSSNSSYCSIHAFIFTYVIVIEIYEELLYLVVLFCFLWVSWVLLDEWTVRVLSSSLHPSLPANGREGQRSRSLEDYSTCTLAKNTQIQYWVLPAIVSYNSVPPRYWSLKGRYQSFNIVL